MASRPRATGCTLPEGKAARITNATVDIAAWLASLGSDTLVMFKATSVVIGT